MLCMVAYTYLLMMVHAGFVGPQCCLGASGSHKNKISERRDIAVLFGNGKHTQFHQIQSPHIKVGPCQTILCSVLLVK